MAIARIMPFVRRGPGPAHCLYGGANFRHTGAALGQSFPTPPDSSQGDLRDLLTAVRKAVIRGSEVADACAPPMAIHCDLLRGQHGVQPRHQGFDAATTPAREPRFVGNFRVPGALATCKRWMAGQMYEFAPEPISAARRFS